MKRLQGLTALLADPSVSAVLAGRRDGLLLLDYDGTLAPFVPNRDEARPYAGVVDVLARLPALGPGRFVMVTGRAASELHPFLAPAKPMEIWGCHGAERLDADGAARIVDVPARAAEGLARAAALARPMTPAQALEHKPVSLALHWRGLPEAGRRVLERDIGEGWAGLAREFGLELKAFDGGLELRLPDLNKGRAVRGLRRENPGTSLLYFGDDLTDEDAFTALGPTDVGVLVRARDRPSAARYRIRPPDELVQFLSLWADALGRSGP
ncbi:trehalose-phosphatase [Solidesulfovibrio sp.]